VQLSSKTILLNTAAVNVTRYILIFINVVEFRASFSIFSKKYILLLCQERTGTAYVISEVHKL